MAAANQTLKGAVFVLGMHRSGTSAITRGLETLGIDLGDNLKESVADQNEKGFFENWTLSTINDELLALRQGQWDSLFAETLGAEPTDQVNALKLRAIAAIEDEFGRVPYFGFKDPRTCRTIPFWKDVIAKAGLKAFYLIAFRNPLSVAKSLQRRDGFSHARSYYLWLLHAIAAVRGTQSEKRVFVDYDSFMEAPGEALERLGNLIDDPNVALSADALRQYRQEFLEPSLRHHLDRPSHLDLDNQCPPDVKAVYRLLRAETGSENLSRAELDAEWRKQFEAFAALEPYSELLNAVDSELRMQTQRVEHLDAALLQANATRARVGDLESENEGLRAQVRTANQASADDQRAIGQLHQALAREKSLSASQEETIRAERAASAAHSSQLEQSLERTITESARHAAENRAAHDKLAERLRAVYASNSWRLTAALRMVKSALTGSSADEHVAPAETPPPLQPLPAFSVANTSSGARPTMVFFTICSRNFLAYAKTLYQSLKEHHPESQFFVALCDSPDPPFDASREPFPFIYLDDLDLPEWREMSERYNITEFNTAIKPFVIRRLMRMGGADCVVYLDPDIIVKSRMVELEAALAAGASAVLTPHITAPAENVELPDSAMLRYGIYNLGFAAFRASPDTDQAVAWWGRRLIKDCVIKLEEGLFVDQKWADLFPAFLSGLHVLRHPGYNVAYWNIAQRSVVLKDSAYYVNGEPLRFAHFSGAKLDDPNVYSRHSGQFNTTNIGDLAKLLDEYRARVFANGHAQYQKMPYAFSWNGAAGVNLHTPKPEDQRDAATSVRAQGNGGVAAPAVDAYRMVRAATHMAGGLPQLAVKATRAFYAGGFGAIRARMRMVREVAVGNVALAAETSADTAPVIHAAQAPFVEAMPWRKKALLVDWSTPRPDQDAGSLSTYHLLRILARLGFDVTFVPSDLDYLGAYTDNLRASGIRCLHREDIGSIDAHLIDSGAEYAFAYLCRAPIAALYIDTLRKHCRNTKIILNTIDLHFVREERRAELSGDREEIKSAAAAKAWELSIIKQCDVTLVMSDAEQNILAADAPNADVRLTPLIIAELSPDCPAFDERADIVFIGGFAHLPNVDAVQYFAREIFPLVRSRLPTVNWRIVGNAPPPSVMALGKIPGIEVTGFIQDIEPVFNSARISVAPLRYGAGVKGKVATSLSHGVPVVATPIAVEGMPLKAGEHVRVASEPAAFADAIVELYQDKAAWERMSAAGRSAVLQTYSVAATQRRVASLMSDLAPDYPKLEVHEVTSHQGYLQLKQYLDDELNRRRDVEAALIRDASSFLTHGFCSICGGESSFNTSLMYAYQTTDDGRSIPNWREHLDCLGCGLQNRLRASLQLFYSLLRPTEDARLYITEQTTALFDWLRARHPSIVGSEFLGDRCALGDEAGGLRNEDLTRLTFADNSFDFVLSFDVMEHVSDDVAAIREVWRCLKPGGRFFFSAPFAKGLSNKVIRAIQRPDASIEHLLPPEYHGNPVDPENGALCFRYFAWDLLDDMRQAGFQNCRVLHYWSRDFAYLGGEQFIFVGDKPRPARDFH